MLLNKTTNLTRDHDGPETLTWGN